MKPALANACQQIAELLRAHPEITENDALLANMVEGSTDAPEAIDAILESAAQDKALAGVVEQRAADLKARASAILSRHDAKRRAVLEAMKLFSLPTLRLPSGTVSVSRGRVSVNVDDVNELPQGYFREVTTRKPETGAIKDALASGEAIPGARLVHGEDYLTVRT